MNIDNIGFRNMQQLSSPHVTGEERIQPQKDSFSRAEVSNPGLMKNLASVLAAKSLDKGGKDYRINDYCTSPDGTILISYKSTKPQKEKDAPENTGYIAAISPKGEILWESPVNEAGLSDVSAGPDSTIFAVTGGHLRALKPDGTLLYEHTFEAKVKDHRMDSAGNHYFVDESTRELYMVNREGNRQELPEGLKGVRISDVLQTGPDELYARDGTTFCRLDLKTGTKASEITYTDPAPPRDNHSRSIHRFEVGSDGRIRLWINESFYVAPPPMDGDLHPGLGFGIGIGHHFPLGNHYTMKSVEILGDDGKVGQTIKDLDSVSSSLLLPDDSMLYDAGKAEMIDNPDYNPNGGSMIYKPRTVGSGNYFIGRITPDGKKDETFIKVEGTVKKMLINPQSGSFMVCHGKDTVSEFNSDGTLIRQQTFPPGKKTLEPKGLSGKDLVIFQEGWGANAFALDMKDGSVIPLTDTQGDHSYRVDSREMGSAGAGESEETRDDACIEEVDDFIVVDGIKLPKNEAGSVTMPDQ